MKRWVLVGVAALCLLAGCGRKTGKTLHVYTWADYIKPELVERFEKENACRVVIDTFDSNEAMYAKIKAGATGYDVIFPSSYMARMLHDQDMIQALDQSKLPNIANVDADYLRIAMDPRMTYSVPYMISYAGLATIEGKVKDFDATWAMLDRKDLAGRMTMLNDMRETIGAALKFLGYSLNTVDEKQLQEARDVVIRWKKNLAKFEAEQYKTGLASGEFLVVHGYSGDILQVAEEAEGVRFVQPREGFSVACDDMVIPVGAPQPDLAHAFINFLHDPQVAAENTEFIMYACPNSPSYALLPEELRNDPVLFPSPEVRVKGEVIEDLGAKNDLYIRIWDEIKGAE
ncbi:MAG: spermidine/putrescine ABC transporter substrate-binding protein [Lentisphaeria bacterium]|nr:spermidine/putrescine ABC transporter substrate-binding protein [Lentisphaeria bacterium]